MNSVSDNVAEGVICSLLCRGGHPWSSVRIPDRIGLSTQDSPVRIPYIKNVGKILKSFGNIIIAIPAEINSLDTLCLFPYP